VEVSGQLHTSEYKLKHLQKVCTWGTKMDVTFGFRKLTAIEHLFLHAMNSSDDSSKVKVLFHLFNVCSVDISLQLMSWRVYKLPWNSLYSSSAYLYLQLLVWNMEEKTKIKKTTFLFRCINLIILAPLHHIRLYPTWNTDWNQLYK
jgi:hypothetical protein